MIVGTEILPKEHLTMVGEVFMKKAGLLKRDRNVSSAVLM
jgi:hypothetical protein